ncbi:MAG TPA: site-specific integrase, partial [Pyrinomonadaceae bacterium]|nr:site-specific integrase [Pyrinomonadaceae bacterium]
EDGTFKKESRTFEKKYQASDFLAKIENDYKKGTKASFETRDVLLKDFAETYKQNCLSQLKSYKDEAPKVDHAVKFFGNIKIKDLRRPQLEKYKKHLIENTSPNSSRPDEPRGNRTIDGYLVRITNLLTYAETTEVITSAPSFKKLLLRNYNKRKETINLEEFFKLLDACDEKYNESRDGKFWQDRKHLKLWLIGLHETAARSSELKQVTVGDINLETRIVKIWEGKRWEREQRSAYISDLFYKTILESGVMERPPETLVFGEQESYDTAFDTAKEIAGTDKNRKDKFLLRDLRRTGITNMFQAGMKKEAIKKQVGHKANSGLTEEVYLSLRDDFIVEENQQYETYMRQEREKIELRKAAK